VRAVFDRLISWTGLLIGVVLIVAGGLLTWASSFIGDQVKAQFSDQQIIMPSGAGLAALPEADQKELKPFAKDGTNLLDTGPEAKAYANHYIAVHMNEAGEVFLARAKSLGVTAIPGKGSDPATPMPAQMNYANASNIAGAVTAAATGLPAADPKTVCKTDSTDPSGNTISCTTADGQTSSINCPVAADADKRMCLTTLAADITAGRTNTFLTGNTLRGLLLYGYAFATMGTLAGIAAILAYIAGAVFIALALVGLWHASKAKAAAAPAAGPKAEPTKA
jgi:hypothetical protein